MLHVGLISPPESTAEILHLLGCRQGCDPTFASMSNLLANQSAA